ncbi:NUDIX domain-containing protein [Candidatus Woesearchaeota archaeon]|nr:NUDIX domain-containing protein [Candidatus Woesearchaeota archaeon]
MKEKTHYIAVTGIIKKDGKYLICKRSPNEKVFPSKWCVPGGKLEQHDFVNDANDVGAYWLDVFEKVLKREVYEETGLEIDNIGYVSNLAFMRPNEYTTIIISLFADYASGEIKLHEKELVDHAWVTLSELKDYDLLDTLYEQIEKVHKREC